MQKEHKSAKINILSSRRKKASLKIPKKSEQLACRPVSHHFQIANDPRIFYAPLFALRSGRHFFSKAAFFLVSKDATDLYFDESLLPVEMLLSKREKGASQTFKVFPLPGKALLGRLGRATEALIRSLCFPTSLQKGVVIWVTRTALGAFAQSCLTLFSVGASLRQKLGASHILVCF